MSIIASELTTGRIANIKGGLKLLKALEKAARKALSIDREEELIQLKGEFEFQFLQQRPFWNDEWQTPSYRYADFRLCRPWSKGALREFCDLFKNDEDFRRSVMVEWRAADSRTPIGLLQIGHENSSRESLRKQEDRSFWEYAVDYNHEREPSETAGDDAAAEIRAAAEAMRLEKFIIPVDEPPRFRIEGELPGLKVSAPSQSFGTELPFPGHVMVDRYPSASEAMQVFENCVKALVALKGPPHNIFFRYLATGVIPSCAEKCLGISPKWDWIFYGNYRKGFDPFAPNSKLNDDVRVYPVLKHEGGQNRMLLLVSVVHAGKKSFLELQSTEGREPLESIAKSVGEKIQFN